MTLTWGRELKRGEGHMRFKSSYESQHGRLFSEWISGTWYHCYYQIAWSCDAHTLYQHQTQLTAKFYFKKEKEIKAGWSIDTFQLHSWESIQKRLQGAEFPCLFGRLKHNTVGSLANLWNAHTLSGCGRHFFREADDHCNGRCHGRGDFIHIYTFDNFRSQSYLERSQTTA